MWVPKSNVFTIDLRSGLLPLSLGLLYLVHVVARPPLAVMLLLCLILPGVLIAWAVYLRRALPPFERSISLCLQRRDSASLERLLDEARILRLLAPIGYFDAKRGMLAMLEEDWERADELLERAYQRQSKRAQKEALLPAILRVKYESGAWEEAEEIATELAASAQFPGTAYLFLGLLKVRRPDDRDEGIALLEDAALMLSGGDRSRAERALQELG